MRFVSYVFPFRVILCIIGGGRNFSAGSAPISMKEFAARLIDTFVGMRSKKIAQRLDQIGRKLTGTIPVEKGKSSRKTGNGNAILKSRRNNAPKCYFTAQDFLFKERVK